MRAQLNRVLVALVLLVGLPAVALTERIRRGAGQRLAIGVLRRLAWACGVRFELVGGEDLVPGRSYVYVPNHRSHLDIPAVLFARPDARFVAASELFRIPLLAGTMRALRSVPIDRKDHRRARAQLAELTASPGPLEVVVFAEGGIELAGEDRPFKSGAFALALDAGADLVPIAIHGAAAVAPPERRLLVRPGTVRVELLPAVSTAGLGRGDRKRLRTEVEAAIETALAADR